MFDALENEQVCIFDFELVNLGARCKALMDNDLVEPNSVVAYTLKTCNESLEAIQTKKKKGGGR